VIQADSIDLALHPPVPPHCRRHVLYREERAVGVDERDRAGEAGARAARDDLPIKSTNIATMEFDEKHVKCMSSGRTRGEPTLCVNGYSRTTIGPCLSGWRPQTTTGEMPVRSEPRRPVLVGRPFGGQTGAGGHRPAGKAHRRGI
jgi:hypothetical protein